MTKQEKEENASLPICDDRLLWDVWMSSYHFPTLCTADELGLFTLPGECKFEDVSVDHIYGYYSLVSARKP